MKRIAALFVGVAMLLGLAACSDIAPADASLSESSAQASAPEESASEATAEESTSSESSAEATPAPQEAEGGKTLVVYYSATGNTEEAANYIAEATGGDLFELEPAEPYSQEDLDWTDSDSRVVYEHDNPDARPALVEAQVENLAQYDTVFLGYPKMEQGYICSPAPGEILPA